MTAVADTSPLLALARLDLLPLLPTLLGATSIPPAVRFEATQRRPDAPGAAAVERAIGTDLLRVASPAEASASVTLPTWFGPGEREAVLLALSSGADWLLLDDRAARRHAESLGLTVIGTVGLLEVARDAGRLPRVAPLLDQLRAAGFRLSADIVDRIRAADPPPDAGAP